MDHRENAPMSRRAILRTALVASTAATLPLIGRPAGSPATAGPVAGDPAELFRALDDLVTVRMAELRVPGVALGVIAGGEEHVAGYGVISVDRPRPIVADTLFRIGSLTKTFTGTAVMRLIEEGQLDLNAPIRTYLPDFRVADEAVAEHATLRHLVTHTAGWFGDQFPESGDGDEALERFVAGLADAPQIAPLGRYFSYNNAAVSTAGRVIEVATGLPYEAALDELVLRPLGLERTNFFLEASVPEEFVVDHDTRDGEPVVLEAEAIPRAANPVGGLGSTVVDLLRYARFHLGDGSAGSGRVLSPAGLSRMRERLGPGGTNTVVALDGVGVTWWLLPRPGGERVAAHLGSSGGQALWLVLVPERGFAVVVLTNAVAGITLGTEVVNWTLERFLGLTEPSLDPEPMPPAGLAEYVGEYLFGDTVIRIEENTGALHMEQHVPSEAAPGDASPLHFVGADRVTSEYLGLTILSDFVRDADDEVSWFRFLGRLCPRVA